MKSLVGLMILLISVATTQQQGCESDVFFIVDSSNVITDNARTGDRLQHWFSIRTMLANVMQRLTSAKISVSIYADTARQVIVYPTLGSQASTTMRSLDFMGGQFTIGASIKWVRENVIVPNKRQNVNTTCVLLATYPPFGSDLNLWNTEKDLLKNACNKLIIVTIGRNELENVYKNVATSDGDFQRIDFTALAGNVAIETFIFNQMANSCPIVLTTTTPTTTTLSPPQGCLNQIDIIYMLDASTNTELQKFEIMKSFVANQILNLDIENGRVRLGILSFSDNIVDSQQFSNIASRSVARNFVSRLNFVGGKCNLAGAFVNVRQVFLTDVGRRSNFPLVVVLLTNGFADNPGSAISESKLLRDTGANILLVSPGSYNNFNVIYSITSYPYEKHFFNTVNYNDLLSISSNVLSSACDNVNECQSNPCQRSGQCIQRINNYFCYCQSGYGGQNCELDYCKSSMNIFFAMTTTSSINFTSLIKQVDFVRNLITNVNLRDSKIGVGTYYDTSFEIQMNFQTFDSLKNEIATFHQRLYDSISSFYRGGYTNLSSVINLARTTVFPDGNNNVLILFVSGPSADYRASVLEASLARTGSKSIQIIVVTVGQQYSSIEVNGIASSATGNGVTIGNGGGYETSPNIFSIDDFVLNDNNMITKLTRSFCNSDNECLSNPCQNQGTCMDLINGYKCLCTNSRTGPSCERDGVGQLDIVIAIDTSGSIRYERFTGYIINFIVRFASRLEISPSKTRVAAIKWNRNAIDLFHLDTYTTSQDVVWALQQITYEPGSGGTNTAAALRMIRDIILNPGQNGERPTAKNIVLLFTDGNSNIEEQDTIPTAVDLRIKREAYIITLGIGSDVNSYELYSISSFPVIQDQSYFVLDSATNVDSKFNLYLQAVLNTQSYCQNNPCQNNGVCINDRKQFICRCYGNYGGIFCEKVCPKANDIAILLDVSGSGNRQQVYNMNVQIAHAIAINFPFDNTKFSIITFGDSANFRYNFNNFSRIQDLYEAFSFRLSSGQQSLRSALSYLYGQSTNANPKVFAPESGDRPNNPNIAVIITNSDSPGFYQDIIQEADAAKRNSVSIYAILVGDNADRNLFSSIVSNRTNLLRIYSENEINGAVDSFRSFVCN